MQSLPRVRVEGWSADHLGFGGVQNYKTTHKRSLRPNKQPQIHDVPTSNQAEQEKCRWIHRWSRILSPIDRRGETDHEILKE